MYSTLSKSGTQSLIFQKYRKCLHIIVGIIIIYLSGCTSRTTPLIIKEEKIISREHQRILSTSAEKAFKKVSLPNLSSKKVFIEITSMTLAGEEQIRQEPFIRSYIEELIAKAEGEVVNSLEKANIKLTARVKIFGADITNHGIPATWFPLFYRDRTYEGTVSVDIIVKDLKTNKLITSEEALGGYSSKRMYFLFIIGPFHVGR